jgi:hypothetical protein
VSFTRPAGERPGTYSAALLSDAARGIRTAALRRALERPPSEWPRSLRAFLDEIPDAPARVPAAGE